MIEIKQLKTNIELHVNSEKMREQIKFTKEEFKSFVDELKDMATAIWKDKFELKEVTSMGNDYWEYYDRKYDNNGYLSVGKTTNGYVVTVERPCEDSHRFYQLNKAKSQTFVNDCIKLLGDTQ
ncbi:hypothetical protein [Mammaliicoccus sciuri]|uniref:hypothetical protein n=1 Tax=Mammaliicoccus sciuri TaxID=1296 RepID=UPI002B25AB35|nr:hypothetical protein [Mammaliicoccus sciuri]WQK75274.1 hypothetical protein P3U33_05950 [Mammaliicoccus sciuri]